MKKKSKVLFIKLGISVAIVLTAVVLKAFSPELSREIGNFAKGDINYREAVNVIGELFNDKETAVEVFTEKSEEKEDVKDESAVEALSFKMDVYELHDDTKAEPFRIPPPSYCSYDKVNITFSYTKPLAGTVTSKYGYRDHPIINNASFHTGMDIAAKSGAAIVCFADGKVVEAKYNDTYGNYLLIEHANGIKSFYGHNSKLNVKVGANVKKGQKIAEVGTTGISTGPHLHFEVRNGNKRLDPAHYIKI